MAKHPVLKNKTKVLKGKSRNWEADERRKAVYRLRLRGETQHNIAKSLGIGLGTVKRDLKVVKDHNTSRITALKQKETIGGSLTVFDEVQEKAWIQYYSQRSDETDKARYLKLIMDAENNKNKLLAEVGYIKRSGAEVNVKVDHKVINNFTPDVQKILAGAMIKAKLSTPQDPVKDDYIEAEVVEDKPKKNTE